MALLSKDQILGADKLRVEDVEVPEWGGSVRVVGMTAGERDMYEDSIYETEGTKVTVKRKDFRAKMLVHCLRDENMALLFTDVSEITKLSAKPIQRLFDVAQELNGLSKKVQDDIEGK